MSEDTRTPGDDEVDLSADFDVPELEDAGFGDEEDDSRGIKLPDEVDDTDARIDELEQRITDMQIPGSFPAVFVAQEGTDSTWNEIVPVSGTLVTGGPRSFTGDTVSGAALISLGAGQVVVLEMKDPPFTRFIKVRGGGPDASMYAGRVKRNGTDGDGLPKYNVYYLSDVSVTTPIASSLIPSCSRDRFTSGQVITEAAEASICSYFYFPDGSVGLHDVAEKSCSNAG